MPIYAQRFSSLPRFPLQVLLNRSHRRALPGVLLSGQSTEYSLVLTTELQSAFFRFPYRPIHPLAPPHISERLLKFIARNERMYILKVCARAYPWRMQRVLILYGTGESHSHATTISITMLPDEALLEIFDFYQHNHSRIQCQWWSLLVHICRKWRQIILESPHRLNLQILCTHGTPVKRYLGIWPAFPIVINYPRVKRGKKPPRNRRVENHIIAALEHPGRVSFFRLHTLGIYGIQGENVLTAMQEPFLVLTRLEVNVEGRHVPVLPAEFLGGSAPRLQEITLSFIPYPALPTLLLSTSDLVKLDLFDIPPTGYISPEVMAASLAALPKLETFVIGFRLSTSQPDRIHTPPATRAVLPALTHFRGASEYLEDLVGRIDCPRLNQIVITYLNQAVDFQVMQLSNFIGRTVDPEITLRHARFSFSYHAVAFTMYPHANHSPWDRRPATTIISCYRIDSQVSHMTQVLSHWSAKLSNVVHLKLKVDPEGPHVTGTGDVEWMRLLHQFSAVQTLHVAYLGSSQGMLLSHWKILQRQWSTKCCRPLT
jgi:hypothetical protein